MSNGEAPPRAPNIVAIGPTLLSRGKVIPSFAQYAVTGEDALVLTTWAGLVEQVDVVFRFLDAGTQQIIPTTIQAGCAGGFVPCSTVIPLGIGYILNVSVRLDPAFAANKPQIGDIFVRLDLVRGIAPDYQILGTILQGYVTVDQVQGFPGSALLTSLEPYGSLQTFLIPNPAVGHDWSLTVPTGVRYKLRAVATAFSLAGVAGNRVPILIFQDPAGDTVLRAAQTLTLSAVGGYAVDWWNFLSQPYSVANYLSSSLPAELWLRPGSVVSVQTFGMGPSDQWSQIAYTVERFIEAS